MRVVVTGAAGFLGRGLIAALLRGGGLEGRVGADLDEIVALDVVLPATADPRVTAIAGDFGDPETLARAVRPGTDSVFHLAAIVSGQAEDEFELGMRVNVDATRALLERVRAVAPGARFVTTSSVAVFGGDLPARVPDTHLWEPQSSYGTQKAMVDLLLSDYARRGFVDARSLRMPTIAVRPGKPNRAASSFASGIIREPLDGIDAVCPVLPETVLWLMSPVEAISNLLHGHALDPARLGRRRVINMPGLSVTVAEMLASLRRRAGDAVADRVTIAPDETVQRIVNSWPGDFHADHARALGFTADADVDAIIDAHLAARAGAPDGAR